MYNLILFWIFSLAEPNSTIIAASIPVLRVLLRDARTTYQRSGGSAPAANGYLKSNNSNFPGHANTSQMGHKTTATRSPSEGDPNHTDASSERSILGHDLRFISRKTEVTVEVDAASLRETARNNSGSPHGEEYEMGRMR